MGAGLLAGPRTRSRPKDTEVRRHRRPGRPSQQLAIPSCGRPPDTSRRRQPEAEGTGKAHRRLPRPELPPTGGLRRGRGPRQARGPASARANPRPPQGRPIGLPPQGASPARPSPARQPRGGRPPDNTVGRRSMGSGVPSVGRSATKCAGQQAATCRLPPTDGTPPRPAVRGGNQICEQRATHRHLGAWQRLR